MSELKPTQIDERKDVKLKARAPIADGVGEVEKEPGVAGFAEFAEFAGLVGKSDDEATQIALQQPSPRIATPALQRIDFPPNYEVIEVLGQGGMGTVYKVFDKALKTVFAIKVLRFHKKISARG